ncbi:MAG TPA: secretin N-terminal domain-containing protein [Candidatus Ozemobacteraceae bacterium]|nr:secretin N-terminal domain-containing protein [Candidatus Ozemobacteraceae bacterium]
MNTRLFLTTLLAAFLLITGSAEAASRVVKLRSQSPEDVCMMLERLFGDDLRCSPVPSIQAVVLAADTQERLDEAAALISRLDRRPATLRYSVRRRTNSARSVTKIGLSGSHPRPEFESRSGTSRDTDRRSVVGMEGAWLRFTDDALRLETVPAPWGPETIAITHRQGIEIRGTRVGTDAAIIELRASSGPEHENRLLLTHIEVPFGRWTELGGVSESDADRNDGYGLGRSGRARLQEKSHSSVDGWEVLVDLLEPGDPVE